MSSISAYAMLYIFLMPASLVGILDDDSLKLYTLIWSQSMACQMKAASIKTVNLFFSANAIIQYPEAFSLPTHLCLHVWVVCLYFFVKKNSSRKKKLQRLKYSSFRK